MKTATIKKNMTDSGNNSAFRPEDAFQDIGRLGRFLDGRQGHIVLFANSREQTIVVGRFDYDRHPGCRQVFHDHGVSQFPPALFAAQMKKKYGNTSSDGGGQQFFDSRLLFGRVDPGRPQSFQAGSDDKAQRFDPVKVLGRGQFDQPVFDPGPFSQDDCQLNIGALSGRRKQKGLVEDGGLAGGRGFSHDRGQRKNDSQADEHTGFFIRSHHYLPFRSNSICQLYSGHY